MCSLLKLPGLSQLGQTARQLECLLTHVAALLTVLL